MRLQGSKSRAGETLQPELPRALEDVSRLVPIKSVNGLQEEGKS